MFTGARGVYLVSMPKEIKYHTNGVDVFTCRLNLAVVDSTTLKQTVSPRMEMKWSLVGNHHGNVLYLLLAIIKVVSCAYGLVYMNNKHSTNVSTLVCIST